jgi:RNA polymerase sigma factor (sigma-70 family)
LVKPNQLAQDLWEDYCEGNLTMSDFSELRLVIYQRYSVMLFESCRDQKSHTHEQAWQELRNILIKKAQQKASTFVDWEDSVQETLIMAHSYLLEERVKKPEQFISLTCKMLKNKKLDTLRHLNAKKRGDGEVYSLDAILENKHEQFWKGFRNTEQEALFIVGQQFLVTAFQALLSTHNQQQVAHLYYLQHLKPREIAQILDKKPHEVRQTVLRVKKRLELFLPEATKWLPPPN